MEPPSVNLTREEKNVLWSPLPALIVSEEHRTKYPSNSSFVLHENQVRDWWNFDADVKRAIRHIAGNPVPGFPVVQKAEQHRVGNETGVQARFIQNMSHEVTTIFTRLGFRVAMGDFQCGKSRKVRQEDASAPGRKLPDLIILENSKREIRVVGEIKTPWTFTKAKSQTQKKFLAQKFGQLARYMDDHQCQYGFFTTYEETYFLRREDVIHFCATTAIRANTIASTKDLSLRECFLFLGLKASSSRDSHYPETYGDKLTRGSYEPHPRPGYKNRPERKKRFRDM